MGNVNSPEPKKAPEMKEVEKARREPHMGGSMGRISSGALEKGYDSDPMNPSTITVGIGWLGG